MKRIAAFVVMVLLAVSIAVAFSLTPLETVPVAAGSFLLIRFVST